MSKYLIFASLILIVSFVPKLAYSQAIPKSQDILKEPRIVIVGKITETQDYFGRKRFIGQVINREKVRIDFIKIGFTLRNRVGKIIGTKEEYIKGSRHEFYDFQVSTSTLGSGLVGNFNIITSVHSDSVYSFSYKISGKHYQYK